MMVLSTNKLPEGLIVKEAFNMVFTNSVIEVSKKGPVRGFIERGRNEYQEAFELLAQQAPKEADAIIGIQISTVIQQFTNGTFLYLTLAGTPIISEAA